VANIDLKREVVRKLLEQFPDAPTRQIARLAAKEKLVFRDEEDARKVIRIMRGAAGTAKRKQQEFPSTKWKPGQRQPAGRTPMPKAEPTFPGWCPLQVDGPVRVGVLSDIHVPYHDEQALGIAIDKCKSEKCNVLLLNGDAMDFYAISHWQRDPRKRDFILEIERGVELIRHLRSEFPKARIIYKLGNHDERLENYLIDKAPELLGLPCLKLSSLLEFDKCKVEEVRDSRPITLGKLYTIHGHEYRFAISNPVNAARGLFLRAKTSSLCGHFHQSNSHSGKTLADHVITAFSTGALCNLRYNHGPINEHNHGFAIVNVAKDNAWEVQNYRILRGKAYL
jgi:predicted phosphodiesterase